MTSSILIREVGPREGFQTISDIIPTEKKLALIDALSVTGVQEIEICSFVRPDRLPQMADADQIAAHFNRYHGVRYLGLYLNQQGFERAEACKRLDNRGWIYTAASEKFLRENNNTNSAEIVATVPAYNELFKKYGKSLHGVMVSTAFGYPGEERIPDDLIVDRLRRIIDVATSVNAKVQEISLADTVGFGVPDQVRRLVSALQREFAGTEVSLHLHDTRGAGLANAYAGYLEGVRIFESSVGGLGGCPFAPGASGNIVTEELVALFEGQGVNTGIDLKKYIEAAQLAEKISATKLPSKLLRKS